MENAGAGVTGTQPTLTEGPRVPLPAISAATCALQTTRAGRLLKPNYGSHAPTLFWHVRGSHCNLPTSCAHQRASPAHNKLL